MFPNGKPYENTIECWDALNIASKAARYLRLVDPAAFNDRRSPEVQIYAPDDYPYDPSVYVYNSSYNLGMKLPGFPDLPSFSVNDYRASQPYHLEVWCEKSTMNDVLAPMCERYGANLQTGMGEMSITAVLALAHRLQQAVVSLARQKWLGQLVSYVYEPDNGPIIGRVQSIADNGLVFVESLPGRGYIPWAIEMSVCSLDRVLTLLDQ